MFALKLIITDTQSVELRQLAYFDAIVRHGGFTRAAEQLHVAQPAVSAQMRNLETELGVTLLARTTRQVKLTDDGARFLIRARRILEEVDAARADLSRHSKVLRGRVRIGAVEALGPLNLSSVLAKFRDQHPGIELNLRSSPTGEAVLDQLSALD